MEYSISIGSGANPVGTSATARKARFFLSGGVISNPGGSDIYSRSAISLTRKSFSHTTQDLRWEGDLDSSNASFGPFLTARKSSIRSVVSAPVYQISLTTV
jgi:hypothetical protein